MVYIHKSTVLPTGKEHFLPISSSLDSSSPLTKMLSQNSRTPHGVSGITHLDSQNTNKISRAQARVQQFRPGPPTKYAKSSPDQNKGDDI